MITDESLLKNNTKKYIIIGVATLIVIIIVIIIITRANSNIKLNIDLENMCISNTYDGSVKTLSKLEKREEYTLSANEAVEAGTYDITITPNKGYIWQDKSKKAKTIQCTIDKATSNLNISKDKITINKGGKDTITIDTSVEGKITAVTESNIIKISNKEIVKKEEKVQLTITSTNEGQAILKITFTPDNNNYATEEKEIEINITNYKKVKVPTTSICNNNTYNGNPQKLVSKTDYEGYTLKGQIEGTNAGNYKIQAELKDGYIWNDGSNKTKNITCTIKKEANYSIVTHRNSCKIGETAEFTIESKKEFNNTTSNDIKNISNNPNLTTISKKTKCDCINYIGYNQNTGMCADCIYLARYEVKCNAQGEDNIKITMDNGEVITTKIIINKGDTIILGTKNERFDGIKCTAGKEIPITISTYIDSKEDNTRFNTFSIKNTSYATVSKSSKTSTTATNLIIKCVKKGNTELIITTKDGTTAKFPIIY